MDVAIDGPAGALHGVLWEPEGAPRAAAAVCHPHPEHGGTMDSNVVFRAARGLQAAGLAVLRFDFRGVRRSEGGRHGGDGAEEDLAAALRWLGERYPDLPLWAGGFSFGARAVCGLLAREPGRVERVLLVALPVLAHPCEVARDLAVPGLVLTAEEDRFGARADLAEHLPELAERLEVREIAGAEHFFTGALDRLQEEVHSWAARNLP